MEMLQYDRVYLCKLSIACRSILWPWAWQDLAQIATAWSLCRGRFSTAEDGRYYKGNIRRCKAHNLFVKGIAALKFDITCYGSQTLFYNVLHGETFNSWKVAE
jgi:hypothetical protein